MMSPARLYLLLFSLYWAQGLPVGFMTHALPVILRAQGVSLAHIGGFGLLMLPWSIKILWAPWVDRYGVKRLGHYRSWILLTQFCSILGLFILSLFPISALSQTDYLLLFFVLMFWINFAGATQDIATDALAVNLLKTDQQHWGNTFQVVGSRLGFIVGGGVVLWALDAFTWQMTFGGLAVLVLLNTLPVLLQQPQHDRVIASHTTFSQISIRQYFHYFTQSSQLRTWLWVLFTFKIADGMSGPVLKPLLVDMGLNFTQIGLYVTILGAFAALLGAACAGFLLKYYSRSFMLIVFSILKLISLAGYVALSWAFESKIMLHPVLIYSVNALEDLFAAMLLVVMLTLVMQYSRAERAGTDFTFQVAIMATVGGGLYTVSGVIADQLGYTTYLSMVMMIGILCLIPILKWIRQLEKQST